MCRSSSSPVQDCCVPCVPLTYELKMIQTDVTSLKSVHSSTNSDIQEFQTAEENDENGPNLIKITETCPLPKIIHML
ncbi:hypothetical protein HNY73_003109 [Argiope bruennichi]|uniref:Uncharacterized protein n=1 Tax=Argiope bruennichi TaxID=94029 RepID=A0A8T0FX06_ARGBR|nr:hypothetical protein HNY73_003109 [Argiope bruennichi]